ncbi:MAG: SUMF1/EgtB/PvdO family nonheme iron enzyme [Proteobacteria bacterium]|nr:SUMF1/EgtB/PvdO family nonheme iron enzyme [Pseudomonadota bacterium]
MDLKYCLALAAVCVGISACTPVQRCYRDADCESPMICKASGVCDYRCSSDVECGQGFMCQMHTCMIQAPMGIACPEDMVPILDSYCMDIYEASRPDATASSAGQDSSRATSRAGVMPWMVGDNNGEAESACQAAGKRLCTPAEWELSCHGSMNTVYGYGDNYNAKICNGIDTYGSNGFKLMPTGSFPDCNNGWGVFDLNGNVWEHTAGGSAKTVRGGAYNCMDSEENHQCSYVPVNWTPLALGFRCCSDGSLNEGIRPDAGENAGTGNTDPDANPDDSENCLDPENPGTDPEKPGTDPEKPGTDPEKPGTDPEKPGTDPEKPGTDPEKPGTDPEKPGTDPEKPGTDPEKPGTDPEKPTPVVIKTCPEDMALIQVNDMEFCMDRYEASRTDAAADSQGSSETPVSKAGLDPWYRPSFEMAVKACQSVGKHLCRSDEWYAGCTGEDALVYSYGNTYEPTTCNGIDTYCYCDSTSCDAHNMCPFGHCYLSCGADLRIMPTGSFEKCANAQGVYDLNGNLWEYVDDGSDSPSVRGGAYNCIDSEELHKCSTSMPVGSVNAYGFRCCREPDAVEQEVPEARNMMDFFMQSVPGDIGDSSDEVLLAWNPVQQDTMSDFGELHLNLRSKPVLLASNDDEVPPSEWINEYECMPVQDFLDNARILWEYQETRQDAVDVMKFAQQCHPGNMDIQRALGISYARVENYSWALRTLMPILEQNPEDCATRTWIAWIYVQMAMPDEAAAISGGQKCETSWMEQRLMLVTSMNELAQGKTEQAGRHLERVYESEELTRSDAKALRSLQSMAGTGSDPNLTWKLEIDGGYASNALSGSPNDPNLRGKDMGSPFLEGEARFMIDPWKRAFARAVLEAQVTGQWLTSNDAENSSYGDIALRPGVVLDWDNLKFGAYYRPEFLILHGGDVYEKGPLLFYTSHRIEVDFEINKWLYLFGGYGHRTFRQIVRTRDEMDLGAGGRHSLGYGFALTWGATYRHWFSVGDMYDLNGINFSLALDYRIHDVLFRLNGSYALDDYADSAGYFDHDARRDHGVRGGLQIWSPSWGGVRIGAQFKASRRWSSADDYAYQDYRGMIAIRWTGDLDFYSPHGISDDVYALPWNFDGESSSDRIRDIIRQDEDMQRSSSCLQN